MHVGFSLRIQSRMPELSNWNTATVSPRVNSAKVSASSSGSVSRSIVDAVVLPDHPQRVLHHRERTQPEEVHLQQSGSLEVLHVVLRHDLGLRRLDTAARSR